MGLHVTIFSGVVRLCEITGHKRLLLFVTNNIRNQWIFQLDTRNDSRLKEDTATFDSISETTGMEAEWATRLELSEACQGFCDSFH
jgi:hypothetical protein